MYDKFKKRERKQKARQKHKVKKKLLSSTPVTFSSLDVIDVKIGHLKTDTPSPIPNCRHIYDISESSDVIDVSSSSRPCIKL